MEGTSRKDYGEWMNERTKREKKKQWDIKAVWHIKTMSSEHFFISRSVFSFCCRFFLMKWKIKINKTTGDNAERRKKKLARQTFTMRAHDGKWNENVSQINNYQTPCAFCAECES